MKYIIWWEGNNREIVEAKNEQEALDMAYDAWREDAESQADYGTERYSEEAWEEYQ